MGQTMKDLLSAAAVLALSTSAMPHRPGQSNGCGKHDHSPGFHTQNANGNLSIESGGLTRYYAVQVPLNYCSTKPYGLIIDYHGAGGNPTQQWNNSQYYAYQRSEDYVIVYPQGYDRHWQGPSYATEGVDDLQFTSDLLAHMEREYCIDSSRVYASGKSNGGGFVDLLACSDAGDAFAAFAMASAALYTDTSLGSCSKRRAILESHGDQDTTIPYHPEEPGSGGELPDVGDWVEWWGERDCGSSAKAEVVVDAAGEVTTYSCHSWKDVVTHYHLKTLDHCWPDAQGDNYDAVNSTHDCKATQVLDFTSKALDFFGRWDLGNAPGNK